ncbi:Protein of unknown function DUF1442 [Dillenia turbinata]|uniref:Uncharacterized protein n=1 Tax=Dillenia turbinata TaxID=194707 RepID=A0AAN8ZFP7_9MAGN
MACWSAENATKAYLSTIKMGKRAKEPNVAEFISALAAGSNAQLMVMACAGTADPTILALVAAAHQTGGRVVCILGCVNELRSSKEALGLEANCIEFVIGDAQTLLFDDYREADFVLIDCNIENNEGIVQAMQEGRKQKGAIVLGYNAFCKGSWRPSGSRTQLLPIGEGLLMTRIGAQAQAKFGGNGRPSSGKRSHWVVKVDKCTGEEHVFRVRSPHRKQIEA